MKYKVLKYFEDLQDESQPYDIDDFFPRKGFNPSTDRINELLSDENLHGEPLIEIYYDEENENIENESEDY